MLTVNTRLNPTPIVLCDFGWDSQLPELHYSIGAANYPPTAPAYSSTATYLSGSDVYYLGNEYVATQASGPPLFPQSPSNTSFWKLIPDRFYVYQAPLMVTVTFDAIDSQSLGLPKVQTPSGISILAYQWDFGNGQIGFGSTASTTYVYTRAVPGLQVSLTVTDSLGQTFSCAHQLNLLSSNLTYGVGYRIHPGSGSPPPPVVPNNPNIFGGDVFGGITFGGQT